MKRLGESFAELVGVPLRALAEKGEADAATADLESIATILLLAVGVGFAGRWLRQPLIVSFILVGILAGPFMLDLAHDPRTLEFLSHIGIALLLFIVGLKLDVAAVRTMGPVALATGLGQVVFTSAGGLVLARLLGMGWTQSAYVAIALTFSSTIIIVKLLSDKREIDALHGRIAIGFLIVQDLAVVLAMIVLTAVGAGSASAGEDALFIEFALVAGKGLGLVAGVVLLMRWGLPQFLRLAARSPELLTLFSIAWAIGLSVVGDSLGFSKEIGAFLAGVSIASTPFRESIASRLVSLRDFLLLFFFIHLGAGLDLSRLGASIWPATVLSVFVLIGNPLIVMAIMGGMGYRKRTGFLAGLTVAQISEFSLILVGLGASLGHIDEETVGLVTLVGLVTIGLSTYMILYSEALYRLVAPWLGVFERRVPYREVDPEGSREREVVNVDVVVFGLGNYGSSVVRGLLRRGRRVFGVDFDPQRLEEWRAAGLPVAYGDASDPELLAHLPVAVARWVVLALPDRETATTLIELLRADRAPTPIAVAARTRSDAEHFTSMGVERVLRPFEDAADLAVDALDAALHRLSGHAAWPAELHEIRLESGSVQSGRSIREIGLREEVGVHILAVSRAGRTTYDPDSDFVLYPGDLVVLLGDANQLLEAARKLAEREFGPHADAEGLTIDSITLPDRSGWANRSIAELAIRKRCGITVIGIERDERRLLNPSPMTRLADGDVLIVTGPPERIADLRRRLAAELGESRAASAAGGPGNDAPESLPRD